MLITLYNLIIYNALIVIRCYFLIYFLNHRPLQLPPPKIFSIYATETQIFLFLDENSRMYAVRRM